MLRTYRAKCWNIVNWTPTNKLQWNFHRNYSENALENVVCEMASISSRSQCNNTWEPCTMHPARRPADQHLSVFKTIHFNPLQTRDQGILLFSLEIIGLDLQLCQIWIRACCHYNYATKVRPTETPSNQEHVTNMLHSLCLENFLICKWVTSFTGYNYHQYMDKDNPPVTF